VCLVGLRFRQTHFGAAAPPICSFTVELDSPFGAEEMCLAKIITPAPKNESLNRLCSFGLFFLCWCDVRVLCSVVCAGVLCVGVHGVRACCAWVCAVCGVRAGVPHTISNITTPRLYSRLDCRYTLRRQVAQCADQDSGVRLAGSTSLARPKSLNLAPKVASSMTSLSA
jgi:hypothetical protein